MWEDQLNKMSSKLPKWRSKNLSFGIRMCLIRSIVSSLPLYLLSFYKMPKVWSRSLLDWRETFYGQVWREEQEDCLGKWELFAFQNRKVAQGLRISPYLMSPYQQSESGVCLMRGKGCVMKSLEQNMRDGKIQDQVELFLNNPLAGMIWGGYVDIMRKQDDLIHKWYLVLEMAMW